MEIIKISAIILLSLSCNSANVKNEQECDRFRTGTFFNKRNKDGVIDTKITRTNNYQIEEHYEFNATAKFRINWTGKCSYELLFESGNAEARKIIDPTKKVFVEIVQTTDDACIIEGWLEGSSIKFRSELRRE